MRRSSRALLWVGLLAILGVVALGMMARRYAALNRPTKSVADLAPAPRTVDVPLPEPPQPPPPERETEPPAVAAPAEAGTAAEAGPPPVAAEQLALVDGFIAARARVAREIEDHPVASERLKLQFDGINVARTTRNTRKHSDILMLLRTVRLAELQKAGMTEEQYRSVRDDFRSWHAGELDPGHELAAAFEARRERLEPLHLGDYEVLDF